MPWAPDRGAHIVDRSKNEYPQEIDPFMKFLFKLLGFFIAETFS